MGENTSPSYAVKVILVSCLWSIVGFSSRDQQPCFSTKTKEKVCFRMELNFRRTWTGGSNMAAVKFSQSSRAS